MEPYLNYAVSPYRASCPFCGADEEFDIQDKTFEVVAKMGKDFMDIHGKGKCLEENAEALKLAKRLKVINKLSGEGDAEAATLRMKERREITAKLNKIFGKETLATLRSAWEQKENT